MKTSLAIVLAAAALVFSATVSLNPTAASACYSNKSPLCGAVAPPISTRRQDPRAQAHIAVRCDERYTSQPLPCSWRLAGPH